MPAFMQGLELCGLFYEEVVKPVLDSEFLGLRYDAALIGPGSEVLGYDTPESTDHDWGPRLTLFLSEDDHPRYAEPIRELLRSRLPYMFRGYPTSYAKHSADKALTPELKTTGPVNHHVDITTVQEMLGEHYLHIDPFKDLTAVDWLLTPEQHLLTLSAGRVYHDGLGQLAALRAKLAYYPHDVWLYLLSAQWMRISQEDPFMGRTAVVGDELGSTLVAGRQVRDVMKLCFLMEKRYAPYTKWFGTAFSKLACAEKLTPLLQQAVCAEDWQAREQSLAPAYKIVAEMHNRLGITEPLPTDTTAFWGRPYLVIHGERFAEAIRQHIQDEVVRRLPPYIGGVDQFIDSTDVLSSGRRARRLGAIYVE